MDGNSEFLNWLNLRRGLNIRSARDVVSRLKRANRFINVSSNIPEEDLIFEMSKNPEFNGFSTAVKSQLKRAVHLYKEFISETKRS